MPHSQLASVIIFFDYCAWPAGAQIAKLTPFRSFVVILMTALSLTIMALLKFKGGTITYVIVSHSAPVCSYVSSLSWVQDGLTCQCCGSQACCVMCMLLTQTSLQIHQAEQQLGIRHVCIGQTVIWCSCCLAHQLEGCLSVSIRISSTVKGIAYLCWDEFAISSPW